MSSFIADRAWCSASFARPSVVSTCTNRQCGSAAVRSHVSPSTGTEMAAGTHGADVNVCGSAVAADVRMGAL